MQTERHDYAMVGGAGNPSLVRWGAAFAGLVIAAGLLFILAALWLALAFAAEVAAIQSYLGWYLAGSAILAMLVAGFLAGWLSGVPGVWPGIANGLTAWGLTILVSTVAGLPGVLGAFGPNLAGAAGLEVPGTTLWVGFFSLLIGAVTAALGGAIGGATTHPAAVTVTREDTYVRSIPEPRTAQPVGPRDVAPGTSRPPAGPAPGAGEYEAAERVARNRDEQRVGGPAGR